MRPRPGLLVALVIASATAAACGTKADPTPSTPSTPASSLVAPGSQSPHATWSPPAKAVDPATVERDYTPVLTDAVRAATAEVAAQGGSLRPSAATVSTELYDGVCVVKVEQSVTVSSLSDPDSLKQALSTAVARHGFPDLDFANDPGGALTYDAHDAKGALFEFRSKGETTVAVRVATADSACSH